MSTAREQSSARVEAVDAAFVRAISAWTGVGVSLGGLIGVTPQSQVLTSIRQMRTLGRDPWAARRDKLTEADRAGWARWIQDGNDLLRNLATTAQDAEVASLPAIVFDTVTASVADAKSAAKSVWQFKWVLAAIVAAVAVIVWKAKP